MSDDTVTIVLDRKEMAARGRVGGLTTASRHDMSAIASRARDGLRAKFLREAGGDEAKAEVLRRLYFARLNLASLQARTKKAPADGEPASAQEVRHASATTPTS